MSGVVLYDTTLRDGAQTRGISLSAVDKLRIAEKLDKLGIHYIEGGWPGSNPKDMAFFRDIKKVKLSSAKIAAFGSTRRAKVKAAQDTNIKSLIAAGTPVVTIFGKSWDLHVKDILRTSYEENIEMIRDSVAYLKGKKKEVFYDAEHFFDGYRANPDYALQTIKAAEKAGADSIVLCDTNGGTLTSEIFKVVEEAKAELKCDIGIHTHNDSNLAVANSIASIQAGCVHVQGTINGLGERCGNADLIPIIAILKLKLGVNCISVLNLRELTEVSRFVAEVCNMKQMDNQPFVGASAFAHKAGVHVNAITKNPKSYEHVDPVLIGNRRKLLVSELSGKSSIIEKAKEFNVGLRNESESIKKILVMIQDLENEGYHFEAAEASFELLMNRAMERFREFFELEGFRVIVQKEGGEISSEAIVKVKVGKKREHMVAFGDGPVNALDNALRKSLKKFYPSLDEMHLADFKVRVLDEKAGTAAKVRVLIQSQNKKSSWWTVGVSENIIEASWIALADAIQYKLLKDKKHTSGKRIHNAKRARKGIRSKKSRG